MNALLVLVALVGVAAAMPSTPCAEATTNTTDSLESCPFCCGPSVDNPCTDVVIEALVGDQGHVAVVPNYGTCQTGSKNWRWVIVWGDGSKDSGHSKDLLPIQKVHQYSSAGSYNVIVRYCKKLLWSTCSSKCFTKQVTINTADGVAKSEVFATEPEQADFDTTCESCAPSVDSYSDDVHFVQFGVRQVNVAVVPNYGSCTDGDENWEYCVYWGDGKRTCENTLTLTPFQETHQYKRSGIYLVSFAYCKGDVSLWCPQNCYIASKVFNIE